MSKISKFLICTNPMVSGSNLFILSTRSPEVLFKVIDDPGNNAYLVVEKYYSGDEYMVTGAMNRALEWYIAYKSHNQLKRL